MHTATVSAQWIFLRKKFQVFENACSFKPADCGVYDHIDDGKESSRDQIPKNYSFCSINVKPI